MQYIQPQHHARLAQAELLVIDEAAAIPLPLVRAMLGPYLVFLCSTVNGYEGALCFHSHQVSPAAATRAFELVSAPDLEVQVADRTEAGTPCALRHCTTP